MLMQRFPLRDRLRRLVLWRERVSALIADSMSYLEDAGSSRREQNL